MVIVAMVDGPKYPESLDDPAGDADRIAEDLRMQLEQARRMARGYRRALESCVERKPPGDKPQA